MASNETTEGFIKVPRKTSEEKAGMPRTRSQTEVENARIASLITKASEAAPPALAVYLKQATPVFQAAWAFLCLVAPLYLQLWTLAVKAYETLPMELIEALMGLGMCFAGGAYCASIAAVEAFRMTGWDTTRRALREYLTRAK